MSTEQNMAQQALRIYDERGEEAMAAFLIEHEDRGKTGPWDEWSYRLEDGSVIDVSLGPGGTYVMITEPGSPERPAALTDLPPFFDRHQPMLGWPNAGTVMRDAIESAVRAVLPGNESLEEAERVRPNL